MRRWSRPPNPKDRPGQKPVARAPITIEHEPAAVIVDPKLTAIATEIRAEHEQGLSAFRRGFDHFLRVGELLRQARAAVGHGHWTRWLLESTSISETAARGYIRMAEEYPKLDAENRQRVADLPWREALKAIAKAREETTAAPSASPTTRTSTTSASDLKDEENARLKDENAALKTFRDNVVAKQVDAEIVAETTVIGTIAAADEPPYDTEDLFARRRRQLADLREAWERADSAVRAPFFREIKLEMDARELAEGELA
jgi:hypothetical protein